MFKNKYEADNSRFGEVLTQALSAHGIGVRQFLAEAKVGKTRFYAIKRGQGDYSLSTYVRIVSAMREFIFNEAELLWVQEMLVKAAFAQVYRKGNRGIADNV